MAQTSYSLNMAEAFAGMKVDSMFDHVESFAANAEIAFGLGLKADGTDPDNIVDIVNDPGDTFRGISLHQHNEDGKYNQYDTVNVLRKGKAWVEVSATVATDQPAYVDVATGKFTATAGGNLATNGVFRSSRTYSGGAVRNIAIVEINLP